MKVIDVIFYLTNITSLKIEVTVNHVFIKSSKREI